MSFDPHLKDQSDEMGRPLSKKALLVSVYSGAAELPSCHEHLNELALLCETLGLNPADSMACHLRRFDSSTFLTKGKVEEVHQQAEKNDVDVIVFDDEISPAQQRNLEAITKKEVIDRSQVIISVFALRARSREARLQIELAKVRYESPRLKRLWTHLSRQKGTGGSSGFTKGEGEKQLEIDRRILKDKIAELQKEIDEIKAHRSVQRQARTRSAIPTFAIIGYTNVGKSTLLKALTHADVFVEDKLFATLDTTTRKFSLKNSQEILLIDTVGFIRKLPHLLVASFKSTLEEALEADFILHVVDASHPNVLEQAATTMEVLKELNAAEKPMITVANKVDQCDDPHRLSKLMLTYPHLVKISALKQEGFEELQDAIIMKLSQHRKRVTLKVPQKDYGVVTEIIRIGNVINQEYEDNDVILNVELTPSHFLKYQHYQVIT